MCRRRAIQRVSLSEQITNNGESTRGRKKHEGAVWSARQQAENRVAELVEIRKAEYEDGERASAAISLMPARGVVFEPGEDRERIRVLL